MLMWIKNEWKIKNGTCTTKVENKKVLNLWVECITLPDSEGGEGAGGPGTLLLKGGHMVGVHVGVP